MVQMSCLSEMCIACGNLFYLLTFKNVFIDNLVLPLKFSSSKLPWICNSNDLERNKHTQFFLPTNSLSEWAKPAEICFLLAPCTPGIRVLIDRNKIVILCTWV